MQTERSATRCWSPNIPRTEPIARTAAARLATVLAGHALWRIGAGTAATLIGLFLASDRTRNGHGGAAFAGTLGALSFAVELVTSIPLGIVADRVAARTLMAAGAAAGTVAALLFAIVGTAPALVAGRVLEGFGSAAIVPALLAFIADSTEGSRALRARTMSGFELTLLAGLASGGLAAATFFGALRGNAFFAVAGIDAVCALLLFAGAGRAPLRRAPADAWSALRATLGQPALRRLAPVWLCVNAVVGIWLGPTLPFLLTGRPEHGQLLAGLYAGDPVRVGWLLFGYAIVFATGVSVWSIVLPRIPLVRALRVALAAMLPACAGITVLNHAAGTSAAFRWGTGAATALFVMIESGFTPAALAWLAHALPVRSGRGTAMGIYSVLLGVGAIAGSLLAAFFGARASIDGLLLATALVAFAALLLLARVSAVAPRDAQA